MPPIARTPRRDPPAGPARPLPGRAPASAAAGIMMLAALVLAPAARADDLDDSVPLQHALAASREVLLVAPQAVRQECVDALRELASTRETVEFDTRARGIHNLSVARDVLAADYDSAARVCGEDAARACAPGAAGARTAGLSRACAGMLPLPPP